LDHCNRDEASADFEVSPEQALAWDEHEAETSKQAQEWLAARFHLERLVAAQPGDASYVQRRTSAYAREALESRKGSRRERVYSKQSREIAGGATAVLLFTAAVLGMVPGECKTVKLSPSNDHSSVERSAAFIW
jgi:hypothetical protein